MTDGKLIFSGLCRQGHCCTETQLSHDNLVVDLARVQVNCPNCRRTTALRVKTMTAHQVSWEFKFVVSDWERTLRSDDHRSDHIDFDKILVGAKAKDFETARVHVVTAKPHRVLAAPLALKPCALILSVQKDRENGAGVELSQAYDFLSRLGFDPQVVTNPTAQHMKDHMKSYASTVTQGHQMCAVAIMAHGSQGQVVGSDDRGVRLEELFAQLNATKADHLRTVQKYFFVQACRRGTEPPKQPAAADVPLMDMANFHWCYATVAGQLANRGTMFECLLNAVQDKPHASVVELCQLAARLVFSKKCLLETRSTLVYP